MKLNNQLFVKFGIALFLLFNFSCRKDKYDLSEPNVELNPEFAVPLVNANLNVRDLLDAIDTDYLEVDPDGELKFVFSDTLMEIQLSEVLDIPNQNENYTVSLDPISLPDQSLNGAISLNDAAQQFDSPYDAIVLNNDQEKVLIQSPSGTMDIGNFGVDEVFEDFEYADFQSGDLRVELTNNWDVELQNFKVALVNIVNNNPEPVDTFDFGTVPPGATGVDFGDLSNKTLYQDLEINIFSVTIPSSTDSVFIDLASELLFDIEATNLSISGGSIKVSENNKEISDDTITVPFAFENEEEISRIILKSGEFKFDINFEIGENAQIEIEVPQAQKNGQPFSENIVVNAFGNAPVGVNETFDLEGYELSLNAENEVEVYIKSYINGSDQFFPFSIQDEVSVDVSLENMGIQLVEGYFGQQEVVLAQNEANLEFGSNPIVEFFDFVEPVVTLYFDNSFGLPFDLDIDLELEGADGDVALDLTSVLNDFTIAAPSTQGGFATSSFSIGNETNIIDAIDINPHTARAGGKVILNPMGRTGIDNFALDTSKLRVRVALEVPLHGTIQNYSVQDTVEVELEETLKNFKKASLRTAITNDFPVGATVQIYFTDENYVVLDSIALQEPLLIEAAVMDNDGNLVESVKKITDLALDESKMEVVMPTKHLILKTTLNSGGDGTIAGRIFDHYEMKIKLGIRAQAKLNTNDEE